MDGSPARRPWTRVWSAGRGRGRSAVVAVLVPALCGLIVALVVASTSLLDQVEHATLQARFDQRGNQPPPKDVVIVALDEDSVRAYEVLPPGSRRFHARLLKRLSAAKPRVIAYDFTFFRRGPDPEDDDALRRAVGLARPVVLSADEVDENDETFILGSTATVEKLGGKVGTTPFPLTAGVYYDRVTHTVKGIPSFAFQAAHLARAQPQRGELDGKGALIDYAGPPGWLTRLSFEDILKGRFSDSQLRDKVVVVGGTYETSLDVHPTPTGSAQMPGVEIQANAIATLLAGVPLRDAPLPAEALVLAGLCLVGAYAGRRGNPLVASLVSAAVLIAYCVAAQLAFEAGTVLAVVPAGAGLAASTLAALGLEQRAIRRERSRLRELVERLAPDEDPDRVIERVAGTGDGAVLVAGTSFGAYRIEGLLGLGGMGVVYRAHQEALDRPVAIKVMAPALAADESVRERLRREALSAARLDHPNVVAVYDAGGLGDRAYIAMQLVEGRALSDLVGTPDLTGARIGAIVEMVAAALDHAHARGVVHRDVKPQNILLEDATGRALLTDFGIAAAAGQERLTSTGDIVGTVAYAAPEQLSGAEPDRLVDVYALGCVVFELLTGHLPFERSTLAAAMYAHMRAPPPDVSALRPDLAGSGIDAALSRALAKDPQERWQSAGELARAVLDALAARAATRAVRRAPPNRGEPTRPS